MNTSQAKASLNKIFNEEDRLEAAAELKLKWSENLDKVVRPPSGFGGITLPPRELIMGKWFKQGDLGFIYGPRGSGKTWLGMFLGRRCAEGASSMGALSEWNVSAQRRVLYVDGEMSLDEIRDRDNALSIGTAPGMFYLQHEALFNLTGDVLNLADPVTQSAISDKCKRDKIDILILDNQSCLFPGLSENAADAWDKVLPWLLELRRNRIAVIIIAHAGRNGFMRGTRFAQARNINVAGSLDLQVARPTDEPGLQAVDYFLWALQRTYEKREDRYLALLWPQCSLVIDVDDTREAEYGAYYTKQKPLTAAALKDG